MFTRSVWQMYAVFQNVVDLQSDSSSKSSNEGKEDLRSTPMTPSATPPFVGKESVIENSSLQDDDDGHGGEEESGLALQISSTSPDISYKKANNRHRHHEHYHYGTHRKCSTLPHPRRHPKIKSEPSSKSSNPLLDTISVLTYDPCDSDDYYDLTSAYEQRRINPKHEEKNSGHTGLVDGDRDSIGYAGSSSTDSGYKSFCPTPEIPDTSFYGAERGQSSVSCSSIYTDSSLSTTSSQGRAKDGSKAKIMMGTKVINRQGGQVSGMFRDSSSAASTSRRSDTSLYDVNLDHLMYLRQSLLSAIQQCESSRGFSQTSECDGHTSTSSCKPYLTEHHLLHPACSEEACNPGVSGTKPPRDSEPTLSQPNLSPSQTTNSTTCSSPTCQKTVRFNTDVKVSTVSSGKSKNGVERTNSSLSSNDRNHGPRSLRNPQATKSKSILKDPLCANLRSQLESGTADCTLEEEIDSLLYGRAEFYDLESVDEFPCSYVTMIEEKYRSGKPSLAKVRKLKGGKVVECKKRQPAVDTTSSGTLVESEAECGKETTSEETTSNSRSLTSSAKCRFTEVARCMLEIIEDLQLKKMHLESVGKNSSDKTTGPPSSAAVSERLHAPGCSALEHRRETNLTANSNDYADDSCVTENKTSPPSNSSYMSASEYHVYEEISYDFVGHNAGSRLLQKAQPADIPPPLPARPSTLFQKLDHQQASSSASSPPQPPCRRDRVSKKTHMFTFGDSSVRDRPKQRSNLYCLFSDQAERRNISRSLEREWRKTSCDNSEGQEDDYGFKRNFPSI